MKASFTRHLLEFKIPANTSRGSYFEKEVYLLKLSYEGKDAIGEVSPLPGLSIDNLQNIESTLESLCEYVETQKNISELTAALELQYFPSIQFALECALEQFKHTEPGILFPSVFTARETGIPINGLIWMAEIDDMLEQVKNKVEEGYECIKLKIGSLDFDAECRMLELIRKKYSAHKISLRVDANGAFAVEDAKQKLDDLSRFDLHSIEQPIKAGQYEAMAELCNESKIPIALDEDLIGVDAFTNGEKLLKVIKPAFLILKPTLLGGFKNSNQWISLARKYNIGYWLTSALESNIGLDAIAQYCGSLDIQTPQGLGTGLLYKNNFKETTEIKKGVLYYKGQ
jgi:o-succinylbenzoate synthase